MILTLSKSQTGYLQVEKNENEEKKDKQPHSNKSLKNAANNGLNANLK